MKKLFMLLICSIIFTPSLMGMKRNDIITTPEHFIVDCKYRILLNLAKNVHSYAGKGSCSHCPITQAKRIISTISRINWDFYKELDKERNDPITSRTMIKNIAVTCYPTEWPCWPELSITHSLKSPGAKKCIQLSNQLYDKKLTPKKIEQLFNDGAILDYSNKKERKTILSYWAASRTSKSMAIIEKLLQLGANHDMYYEYCQGSPLQHAIYTGNIEKIKLLLSYKAKKCWFTVLKENNHQFIDILIDNSTNDELNDGLITCIKQYFYLPEIMQKFIDNGANPSVALPHILEQTIKEINDLTPDHILIQKFHFLCDQQAHDSTTFSKVQNIQTIFSSLATKLENNSPK
jgi:hypothetical protein